MTDVALLERREDPYPAYRVLRESDPVHEAGSGEWYLTRFDDVAKVLSDQRFARQPPPGHHYVGYGPKRKSAFERMLDTWMVYMDPPAHTNLRRLVGAWFTTQRIEAMRPTIQSIIDDLLGRVSGAGRMEAIAELASPLPVTVITSMLGTPQADRDFLTKTSLALNPALDDGTEDSAHACERAVLDLTEYFRAEVAERKARPRDDLISNMVSPPERIEPMGEDDILGTCIFLLWAGYETTKDLIGNALLSLLRHPSQLHELRRNPELISSAIDEFLRFESPIQKVCRWTRADVEFGGRTIPKERLVVALIGAANRDPRRFEDPDRLDIRRADGHLGFGWGIHYCVGSHLGRLETELAVNSVLRRMPDLALATDRVEWRDTSSIRGLKRLPLTFRCN
jgi:cytochrome P450